MCEINPGIEALPCSARRRAIATFHPSNPNGSGRTRAAKDSEQQQGGGQKRKGKHKCWCVIDERARALSVGWRRLDGFPIAWSRLERRNGRTDLVNAG